MQVAAERPHRAGRPVRNVRTATIEGISNDEVNSDAGELKNKVDYLTNQMVVLNISINNLQTILAKLVTNQVGAKTVSVPPPTNQPPGGPHETIAVVAPPRPNDPPKEAAASTSAADPQWLPITLSTTVPTCGRPPCYNNSGDTWTHTCGKPPIAPSHNSSGRTIESTPTTNTSAIVPCSRCSVYHSSDARAQIQV